MPLPPTDVPCQAAGILRLVLFRFPSARFPSVSCVTLICCPGGCPYNDLSSTLCTFSSTNSTCGANPPFPYNHFPGLQLVVPPQNLLHLPVQAHVPPTQNFNLPNAPQPKANIAMQEPIAEPIPAPPLFIPDDKSHIMLTIVKENDIIMSAYSSEPDKS
ncbi:hypothetical protein E4T56_gene13198 [Termitomyces sp. T112]|nr:hypothetical protein E4T56_gene13198 [Termitomyces sp. T112]